jgi:cortexillin 1/2
MKVSDITTDFSDGIRLVQFLELLSGKKIGKKMEVDPKSRIHKIQNVYLAIQFTESLEVKPEGVAAEGKLFVRVICNIAAGKGFLYLLFFFFFLSVFSTMSHSIVQILLTATKSSFLGFYGHCTENTVLL